MTPEELFDKIGADYEETTTIAVRAAYAAKAALGVADMQDRMAQAHRGLAAKLRTSTDGDPEERRIARIVATMCAATCESAAHDVRGAIDKALEDS